MKTEFKIDLSSTLAIAEQKARTEAESYIKLNTSSIVATLMSNGRYGGKEGLGHEIIRKKVEEIVLSDDFSKKIDQIISEVIDEEATRAVRALINSKSRKHLFEPTYSG